MTNPICDSQASSHSLTTSLVLTGILTVGTPLGLFWLQNRAGPSRSNLTLTTLTSTEVSALKRDRFFYPGKYLKTKPDRKTVKSALIKLRAQIGKHTGQQLVYIHQSHVSILSTFPRFFLPKSQRFLHFSWFWFFP